MLHRKAAQSTLLNVPVTVEPLVRNRWLAWCRVTGLVGMEASRECAHMPTSVRVSIGHGGARL